MVSLIPLLGDSMTGNITPLGDVSSCDFCESGFIGGTASTTRAPGNRCALDNLEMPVQVP